MRLKKLFHKFYLFIIKNIIIIMKNFNELKNFSLIYVKSGELNSY